MRKVGKWAVFNLASIVAVTELGLAGIAAVFGVQWLMLIVFGYMLGVTVTISLRRAGYLG